MRRGSLVVFIVGCLCITSCAVASARPVRSPSVYLAGSWIDQNHRYAWSVFARRPEPPEGSRPHGAQRPCISVGGLRYEFGDFFVHSSELCYGTPGFLTAEAEPLIVATTVFSSEKGAATAFGVAAAPAARKLRLTLGQGQRIIRFHELNSIQARKARLRPFRYAGFVMRGEWCIENYEVLNKAGVLLWESGSDLCAPN